jgi:hypothetical protein
MGKYTSDAKTIVVFNRGLRVGSVNRLVFIGHSFPDLPQDAAGVINYHGDVAVVRKDPEGVLFIDLVEPLARRGGGRSRADSF